MKQRVCCKRFISVWYFGRTCKNTCEFSDDVFLIFLTTKGISGLSSVFIRFCCRAVWAVFALLEFAGEFEFGIGFLSSWSSVWCFLPHDSWRHVNSEIQSWHDGFLTSRWNKAFDQLPTVFNRKHLCLKIHYRTLVYGHFCNPNK